MLSAAATQTPFHKENWCMLNGAGTAVWESALKMIKSYEIIVLQEFDYKYFDLEGLTPSSRSKYL